ncbi:MAG: DUF4406 domain-containing protein [Endomicrobium sp.]|jgi:nucleoside 2-deoxyribosyltransferase|nr:DUF4406 domain-containing protein [Endomicrobium sp.]
MKKQRVYIAGKITGVENYREKFAIAEKMLKEKGFDVLNPAKIKTKDGAEYKYYFFKALEMLKHSDLVYFMPCAAQSPGAKVEIQIAELCGIPELKI